MGVLFIPRGFFPPVACEDRSLHFHGLDLNLLVVFDELLQIESTITCARN